MYKNSTYIVLTLIVFSCYRNEQQLLIIRDDHFVEPPYRLDDNLANDSLYRMSERYFVFNYSKNKDSFDLKATQLVCSKLNDSLRLSYYYIDFQDFYYGEYDEGTPLSASFTTNIYSLKWVTSKPNVITYIYENDGRVKEVTRAFNCPAASSF